MSQLIFLTDFNFSANGSQDILLSAYMNSGSRFTGRLLGFRSDSFYFYEPLWKFSTWKYYKPPNVCCSSTNGYCRYLMNSSAFIYSFNCSFRLKESTRRTTTTTKKKQLLIACRSKIQIVTHNINEQKLISSSLAYTCLRRPNTLIQ